jgi:hypothetical protein
MLYLLDQAERKAKIQIPSFSGYVKILSFQAYQCFLLIRVYIFINIPIYLFHIHYKFIFTHGLG